MTGLNKHNRIRSRKKTGLNPDNLALKQGKQDLIEAQSVLKQEKNKFKPELSLSSTITGLKQGGTRTTMATNTGTAKTEQNGPNPGNETR